MLLGLAMDSTTTFEFRWRDIPRTHRGHCSLTEPLPFRPFVVWWPDDYFGDGGLVKYVSDDLAWALESGGDFSVDVVRAGRGVGWGWEAGE